MKFVLGFLAGASIIAGTALMISPACMRKMRRKYKNAKRTVMDMF